MELMSHFWDKRKKRGGKRNPFMSKKYGQWKREVTRGSVHWKIERIEKSAFCVGDRRGVPASPRHFPYAMAPCGSNQSKISLISRVSKPNKQHVQRVLSVCCGSRFLYCILFCFPLLPNQPITQ
jgi:hypothetical protein